MPEYQFAINWPAVQWGYFILATAASLSLGLGAFKIHGERPDALGGKEVGARRAWQKWFNTAGAAVGWIAGWVVLVRWLGCWGFVCPGEPAGWTILLAALAFAGISGQLPVTLMHGIGAMAALVQSVVGSRPKN